MLGEAKIAADLRKRPEAPLGLKSISFEAENALSAATATGQWAQPDCYGLDVAAALFIPLFLLGRSRKLRERGGGRGVFCNEKEINNCLTCPPDWRVAVAKARASMANRLAKPKALTNVLFIWPEEDDLDFASNTRRTTAQLHWSSPQ